MSEDWTFETLRHHLLGIMDERDKRYDEALRAVKESSSIALTAADRAVVKAETATEKRFDSVNEFRDTLADQQRTLMPRSEAELRFLALEKTMTALQLIQSSRSSTGEGTKAGWVLAVGVAGFVFGLVAFAASLFKLIKP